MAIPREDLDLWREDVAKQPKRRRRDRKKPDPPENLKTGEADAHTFAESLPLTPGMIVEERKDSWQLQSPHNDETLWQLQLIQAFGTRSRALLRLFLTQLKQLCPEIWDSDLQQWKPSETHWNAALALVADHKPENSAQAALAAQMVATHFMIMKLGEQVLNRGHMVLERDAALTSKLARIFTAQCEAMLALKGVTRTAACEFCRVEGASRIARAGLLHSGPGAWALCRLGQGHQGTSICRS